MGPKLARKCEYSLPALCSPRGEWERAPPVPGEQRGAPGPGQRPQGCPAAPKVSGGRGKRGAGRDGGSARSARMSRGKHARELPAMTNTFPSTAGAAVPRLPAAAPARRPSAQAGRFYRRGGFEAPVKSGHGRTSARPSHAAPPSHCRSAGEAQSGPGRERVPPCPSQFRPGAGGGGRGAGLRARPAGSGEEPPPQPPLPPRVPGVTGAGRARRTHHHLRNLSGGSHRSAAAAAHTPVSLCPRPRGPSRGFSAPRRPPQP